MNAETRWAPRAVEIAVSHGRLEGLLQEPGSPTFAAIACHPHPLHGGTMNNNVIYRVARALHDAGAAVLRFNFRGVGLSTGTHGDGVGELEDVAAAVDFLTARHPSLPLWIAGFSFGSRVGLEFGARDARVVKLLGVGLAVDLYDYKPFLVPLTKPKAFVQAEHDEFGGAGAIEALVSLVPEPKRLEIVPGASHLFPKKLVELEAAAGRSIEFLKGQ
ncbi:MAG: alpha/beta fold hydrolase [Myxococcales bacterium]